MLNRLLMALPGTLFIASLIFIAIVYGVLAGYYQVGAYHLVSDANSAFKDLLVNLNIKQEFYYQPSQAKQPVTQHRSALTQAGLTKVVSAQTNKQLAIQVIDFDGKIEQQWDINWFNLWPEANHLTAAEIPKTMPGTHIHGAQILDDASVVFNFEHKGLIRLDACGNVMWRLPYRTHHSVFLAEDNTLWIPGHEMYFQADQAPYKNMQSPITEDVLLKVSLDGKILDNISLFKILSDNGFAALLYMSTNKNLNTKVSGDLLHLNDIKAFPSHLEEGVFKHGDIMVSLRNINTVMVLNPENWSIRYISTGRYLRQHDPEFINGNQISVLDNNNYEFIDTDKSEHSAIVIEDARDGSISLYYGGDNEGQQFYTSIMGKHQWLANGNMLTNVTLEGRIIEVDKNKNIVWEYHNLVNENTIGFIGGAERLPETMNAEFFATHVANCSTL